MPKTFGIQVVLSIFLLCIVILSGLVLLFFQFSVSTQWGKDNLWDRSHDDLTIETEKISYIINGYYFLNGLWWWGAPLLATLAALVLLQLPSRRYIFKFLSWIPATMGLEVMEFTVGELLMMLIWGGVNAVTFVDFLRMQLDFAKQERGAFPDEPYWALKWHKVGFSIGYISFLNFAIILFPVSRRSPLFDLMGLSFEKRIKYHRWLAGYALVVVTIHGLSFWILWISRGQWIELALKWGGRYISNNLAGGICLIFGCIMWVSSIEYVRRNFFEVFYKCHIVGFIGFAIFANIHVPGYYYYLPAGLLTYVVDIVLRVVQQSTPVAVQSTVNSDGTVTTVSMKTPKNLETVGVPIVWVSCPEISSSEWHPVTPTISSDGNLTLRFKTYGKWTKALSARSAAGQLSHLHIEGPHDEGKNEFAAAFLDFNYLVFCMGGIAITPALSILEALNSPNVKTKAYPSLHVYWTVRTESELEVGLPSIKKFSRSYPGRLTLDIYITKKSDSPQKVIENKEHNFNEGVKSFLSRALGIGPTPLVLSPLQGPFHLGVLYLVAYSAGFAGLLLGNAWRLEHTRSNMIIPYWQSNIITFVCIMFMSIGWVTLCVLPTHIVKAVSAMRSHKTSAYEIELAQGTEKKITIGGNGSSNPEVSEEKHVGRPAFDNILMQIKSKYPQGAEGTALAGGPALMVANVRNSCRKANMPFHEASFEL